MYQPGKPSPFKEYIQPKTTSQSQEWYKPKTTSREEPSLPAIGSSVDHPTEGPPASLYHEHLTGLPVAESLHTIIAKAKELLHSVQPMNLPGATPLEHLIPLPHYTFGIARLFRKLGKYLKLKDQSGRGPLKNMYPIEDQHISRLAEAEPPKEMEWMSHPHFSRFGRTPKEARCRQPKAAGLGCLEKTAVATKGKAKREEEKLYFTRMGKKQGRSSLLGLAGGRSQQPRLTQGRVKKFSLVANRAGQIGLGKREKIMDKLFFTRPG